jgi:hypothetical protein
MNGAARVAAFAAFLTLAFGGAAAAGAALDPDKQPSETAHVTMPSNTDEQHPVRGLAVAQDELRVVVDDPELRRGEREPIAFRVVDARGEVVRDFDVAHERRMHLIVVRRDLTGFQHLHPEMGANGTWTADVRLDEAGSYRLFADFTRAGEPYTLGSDLRVDGAADLKALPAARSTAVSDGGSEVALQVEDDELRFTVTRDGEPVATEPYLGAGGHLVALRDGDLAFLHVHATGEGLAFEATFPTDGRYRLFLQFKREGRVETVAFTREVR